MRRGFGISRVLTAVVAAATTALALAGPVQADGISVDADTISTATNVNLTACTLPASVSGQVQFNMNNSDDPQHFSQTGGPVVLSFTSTNPLVTGSASNVDVPSTYVKNGDKFTAPFSTTVADGTTAASHQGTATVTVKATQGTAPNAYSKSATYTVTWNCPVTNQKPSVSVTGVSDGASYEFGNVPTAGCSWTDDHDGSGTTTPTVTGPTGPRSVDGLGSVAVACSKTDTGGLTGSASATYTIQDTTPPAIPGLTNVTAAAADASGAHVTFTLPTATDAVDGDVALSCDHSSGALFPLGDTMVTCTATDKALNRSSKSFKVSVTDQTAPVVTVPDARTVSATSKAGAVVSFSDDVSALDNVDNATAVSCAPASGSTFAFGTTMVTCSAIDTAGNKGTNHFSITVQDKTAPVVSVPKLDAVEATGPDGAKVTWSGVSATDDIDGDVAVTCDHNSGDVFALGTTTVTCSATDNSGNEGGSQFDVTVQDTTGPTVAVPDDLTVEATSSTGASVDFADQVSAQDLVDGATTVTCSPASGDPFGLGETTVSCSSTDSHGNTGQASFKVTVQDTTPPAMPTLDDVQAEATSAAGADVDYTVGDAQDLVDGPVAVTCTPASGATFALGKTTVHCTATDAHGNDGHASFTVEVVDTTPPSFDPVNVSTAEATGPQGAQVSYTVSASDAVDPDPHVSCNPASGSWFALGATTVTCTATDASGNKKDTTFDVNVADTTGPLVGSGSNATVEATSHDGAAYTYVSPTAADLVDGDRPVDCTPPSGSTFPLGKTTVTCTAEDLSHNQGSSSFVITVEDTTAPAIPAMSNITTAATTATGATVSYTAPIAHDLVDGDVTTTCDHASGSAFLLGTTTVSCSATDEAGNTATKSFTVSVVVGWSGLQPPVETGGVYKQGSTIPFKFFLTGASAGITSLDARIYVRAVNGSTPGEVAGVSTSAASDGNRFRYSSSDRQYIFNLATKGLAVGTYDVRVDFGDGMTRVVRIVLK